MKRYLLNGVYSYALFGLYALTIAPFITSYFDYGKNNFFVAIFGLIMLVLEYFALSFKLQMVRARSEEKRIALKKENGRDILPGLNPVVLYGFFIRLGFRVIILLICIVALGLDTMDKNMSFQSISTTWMLTIFFFGDMFGALLIYVNSGLSIGVEKSNTEIEEELIDDEEWDAKNSQMINSVKYFRIEILADIILQVYSIMLFTAFWKYINEYCSNVLIEDKSSQYSAFAAAFTVFPMMIIISLLALTPMRIGYWIEDSMEAFTRKEKTMMWLNFFLACCFTCLPTTINFFSLFVFDVVSPPVYISYVFSIVLFLVVLVLQISLNKQTDNKISES